MNNKNVNNACSELSVSAEAGDTVLPDPIEPARASQQVKRAAVRVAIVHDWLVTYAGAERVLEQIIACFPQADIFSLVDFLEDRSCLRGRPVTTSFIQKMPVARRHYRAYLPLMPLAIEQFDLSGYDIVISSSHAVAKGVLTGPDQLHVSYVHSPIRYAWDMYHQYLQQSRLTSGLRSVLARLVLHYIRTWDVRTANSVDVFVANSNFISRRIKKVYQRDARVVFPPVDVDAFTMRVEKDDFYLVASRLVPYKRVELIVEAFVGMPERRLVVIGDGPGMANLRSIVAPNIVIMGYQPFSVLLDRMQRAKAFMCAAEEDFGISLMEAQACGTPVIAYGKGAAIETVRGLDEPRPTGIFFKEPTADSIIAAVERFEANVRRFCAADCRWNAERFSASAFRENFFELVCAQTPALKAEVLPPFKPAAHFSKRGKEPRVVAMDQTGLLGGAEYSMLEILKHLPMHTEAVLFTDGPFRAALAAAGVQVQVLDGAPMSELRKRGNALPGMRAIRCIVSLVKSVAARARQADVIYVNTQRAMVIGVIAGRLARRPVVWHLRDIVSRAHFGMFQLVVIKWCAKLGIARVIANSNASAISFERLTGFEKKHVEVVFDGISPAPFERLLSVSIYDLRVRLNLPLNAFLVGTFSRLASWKGQHVLLEAMLDEPHMHVVIVGAALFGEDAYEVELRDFVARNGLEERVHFLGFRSDIPACMSAVDVVVHSSVLPEPLGRVVVEGMLAQRPVVAANEGGVPEIIDDGVSGLLFSPGSSKELAVALERLRTDKELRERIVHNAYLKVRRQFNTSTSVERVGAILREAAGL